ncbi:hypothetical protein ACTXT7_011430 [Hymenolepis weldensis]
MDENPGKSMRNILPKIFKCLKEQQYIGTVLHQDLGNKTYVLRKVSPRVNADADTYLQTLQTIVFKPSCIESVANGGRPSVFQEDSAPSHDALKSHD